jgi:hypothetical protein
MITTKEAYMRRLERMSTDVTLDDLTTAELMSLAALLSPAHTRVLTGRGTAFDPAAAGKFLRLVRDDDTSGAANGVQGK